MGVSFQRNCGAASVGVLQNNLVLSVELMMQISYSKYSLKPTFERFPFVSVNIYTVFSWVTHPHYNPELSTGKVLNEDCRGMSLPC